MNKLYAKDIRRATKRLENLRIIDKKELVKQCKETTKLNLEICDEFKYVDGEFIGI